MQPARLLPRCCRCLTILDPEQDRYPYAYGDRDASKLCKKCVSALGLGKNMDKFMGAPDLDKSDEEGNGGGGEENGSEIPKAERPSPSRKAAIVDRRRKRILPRRGRPRKNLLEKHPV